MVFDFIEEHGGYLHLSEEEKKTAKDDRVNIPNGEARWKIRIWCKFIMKSIMWIMWMHYVDGLCGCIMWMHLQCTDIPMSEM